MNVMKRFSWLLWRHRRALAAFERAKRGLENVLHKFQLEADACDERVSRYKTMIAEEGVARCFIDSQRETMVKQIGAIDKILNP